MPVFLGFWTRNFVYRTKTAQLCVFFSNLFWEKSGIWYADLIFWYFLLSHPFSHYILQLPYTTSNHDMLIAAYTYLSHNIQNYNIFYERREKPTYRRWRVFCISHQMHNAHKKHKFWFYFKFHLISIFQHILNFSFPNDPSIVLIIFFSTHQFSLKNWAPNIFFAYEIAPILQKNKQIYSVWSKQHNAFAHNHAICTLHTALDQYIVRLVEFAPELIANLHTVKIEDILHK